jgi:hypothetical protein
MPKVFGRCTLNLHYQLPFLIISLRIMELRAHNSEGELKHQCPFLVALLHLCRHLHPKNSACWRKTTPCGIALLEEDLTLAKKIPEALSHPYTRALPSHVSVG